MFSDYICPFCYVGDVRLDRLREDGQPAREAIIEQLVAMAQTAKNSATILRLAEAYAWMVDPSQPHGGGGPDLR